MKIIEIEALSNGAHRNQIGNFSSIPSGWAIIPEAIVIPETFPFVEIEAENGIVTSMVAGIVPEIVEPEPTAEQQIEALKQQLTSTDYKIIKCSEAQLLGEDLPYDIASLHAERQALRDKINELEAKLEAELEFSSESNIENNQEGGAI